MVSRSASPPPSLRTEHAERVRERLVASAFTLLEQGADDLTLRAIARHAGVSERTLYRYFQTREQLVEALTPRLRERTSVPLPATFSELPDYARALFDTFDRNAALVQGMVSSAGAREDLKRTRSRNLGGLRSLIDQAFPGAPAADRAAAASALRVLLSGAGWVYLRRSCGIPNEQIIADACWTLDTIAKRLRRA